MALVGSQVATGLAKFYSREEVGRYLKTLVDYYQQETANYGDKLGTLLRPAEQTKSADKEADSEKSAQKGKRVQRGWVKMGSLLVNTSDPATGMTEVMFQLNEEFKQKLARTSEALKSFEEFANTSIPEGAVYSLHLRNGVPERLVVDSTAPKRESFSFSAKFRLV